MEQTFKYFAFISYSSKDTDWGKRLQRKLEHYRMPATLCREQGWDRRPISPVFFAPTDIQPGGLTEELQERLRSSRNLIVICSPNSARSEWVGKEIAYFHGLGRTDQIHFFIVDGTPHSDNPDMECFNDVVHALGMPEILGANIHEKNYRLPWLNRERAYAQLISKLLEVDFDAIWKRHKRLLIRKVFAWIVGILIVITALMGMWLINQPKDVRVCLEEKSVRNEFLPALKDAAVTLTTDNETKTGIIHSIDSCTTFMNIPHRFMNKRVRMTFRCHDYLDVDTMLILTENMTLNIFRNPMVYGDIHFRLWNSEQERAMGNMTIEIDGRSIISDEKGVVSTFIPLEYQKKAYPIKAGYSLEIDTLFMPCGKDDILIVKLSL